MNKTFGIATKALIEKEDKYLVLFKSDEEDINPNEIDIPGGRLEFGEDAREALVREVLEETGLRIEIDRPLSTWKLIKNDLHLFGVTYLARYISGNIELSHEHRDSKWMTKEEVIEGDHPQWIKDEFEAV